MTGGNGRDVFDFNYLQDTGSRNSDVITDFRHGQDRIDLSGIDANVKQPAIRPFPILGDRAFSRHAGNRSYLHVGSSWTS